MAHLIGGIAPWLGLDNHIFGTNDPDIVFGDPFTTDNSLGVFEIGGFLSSGQGGRDSLDGHGGDDTLFGDAWAISDQGRGGDDQLDGGAGDDTLYGDAFSIDVSDSAIVAGGNDRLSGGKGNDTLYGDGYNCPEDVVATTGSTAPPETIFSRATLSPSAIFSLAGTIGSRAERAMTSSTAMASTRASWNPALAATTTSMVVLATTFLLEMFFSHVAAVAATTCSTEAKAMMSCMAMQRSAWTPRVGTTS